MKNIEHRMANIQRPTSNIQHPIKGSHTLRSHWMFGVGCWLLDVGC